MARRSRWKRSLPGSPAAGCGSGPRTSREPRGPAGEVGLLGGAQLPGGQVAAELGDRGGGAAGEHEQSPADRVGDLSLPECAVLHRGQEVAQPAQRLAVQQGVELVPEHQRDLPGQGGVADLVQRVAQVIGGVHLGQVELELADPAGQQAGGELGDAERFA